MKITFFIETFPNKNSGILNPKKYIPHNLEIMQRFVKDLSLLMNKKIIIKEDIGDNFPNEGVVIYAPYIGYLSNEVIRSIKNTDRIIAIDIPRSELREISPEYMPAGVVTMGALTESTYPNNFWMLGKKRFVGDMQTDDGLEYHDMVTIDSEKFKTLPEALAWYIKELDKSGLVKDKD